MYQEIPTPAVAIHLETAYDNIKNMVDAHKAYGTALRPHTKPHRCPFLAHKELEFGSRGITCAKLGEAEVMADAGITDILIAFPLIGEDKWDRYEKLAKRADLITIVNSYYGAEGLSRAGERSGKKVRVLIEVDSGLNRGGVKSGQPTLEFANSIKDLKGLDICGVMYYSGLIYSAKTLDDVKNIVIKEHDEITYNANMLKNAGFKMDILSAGNSYSGRFPELMQGVTEMRSGNFIFNDCSQLTFGIVTEDMCALRVIATVVATPDPLHAIIDAGSKSLATDLCPRKPGYGWIVGHPEITIDKLNEEHGFLVGDQPLPFTIGEKIAIIPNHACVIPNLNEHVYGLIDGKVIMDMAIAGRGKSY